MMPLSVCACRVSLPAGVLEQRAEQGRQRQRLGQQLLDDGRVSVVGEDRVQCRPDPHHPPARMTRRNGDAKRRVEGEVRGNQA